MSVVTIVDNHSSAMRERPPPPKKEKILQEKKIKVLECSEMARFQIKKFGAWRVGWLVWGHYLDIMSPYDFALLSLAMFLIPAFFYFQLAAVVFIPTGSSRNVQLHIFIEVRFFSFSLFKIQPIFRLRNNFKEYHHLITTLAQKARLVF